MSGGSVPRDVLLVLEALRRIQDEGAWADPWLRALRRREADRGLLARVERRLLGVLERHRLLVAWLSRHLRAPLNKLPPAARDALLLGAWRLRWEDGTPPWAIVDTAVEAARRGGAARQAGVVNAVLRRLIDDGSAYPARLAEGNPALAAALPDFWADEVGRLLPADEVAAALAGLRNDPGLHVVASRPDEAARTEALLVADGAGPIAISGVGAAWRITDGRAMFAGEAWRSGAVGIQDAGIAAWLALLAADAVGPVWDAFAAPGGKLLSLQARRSDLLVIGSDRARQRAALIRAEAARRGVDVRLVVADAAAAPWRPEHRFPTVIADLPCTAAGTIGRHPEIALRLRPEDIADRHRLQIRLIGALAECTAPGGRLWLSTCSLFLDENERVAEALLAARPGWSRQALAHPFEPGTEPKEVLRFWPHRHGVAGFTVQCLRAPTV